MLRRQSARGKADFTKSKGISTEMNLNFAPANRTGTCIFGPPKMAFQTMQLTSFLKIDEDSDFSIYNLPFGIFSGPKITPRPGIALGNQIVHLAALAKAGLLHDAGDLYMEELQSPVLNPLISLGPDVWKKMRTRVQNLFLAANRKMWGDVKPDSVLVSMNDCRMHLPVAIGDYTDFYSSENHAANVGAMFRDPQNPLLPNWKHIPVGYHGRSSSVVVSGTNFPRPKGQIKPPTAEIPSFGPSRQMDMELETGFIISQKTNLGESIDVKDAEDFMFGMVLFNDWSARDIQSWEYVPLGPFLGKNFCSSMSPWIVTMDALKPFRVPMPKDQEPAILPYLQQKKRWTYDIELEAELVLNDGQRKVITRTNQKHLYWSMNQQLAHHTINGCPMKVGDLLASGTISGPTPDSLGCLLEITKRGQNPIEFANGVTRTFMEDGDSMILRGYCQKEGMRVGFGSVKGTVLPAV